MKTSASGSYLSNRHCELIVRLSLSFLAVSSYSCLLAHASTNDSAQIYCQQSCGSVDVPYPFEIAPGCGINGFKVNCSGESIPYLSIESQMVEILEVSVGSMIIDASALRSYSCNTGFNFNVSTGMSLGDATPFVFSGSNRFFVTGCNVSGSFVADLKDISTCNTSFCKVQPTFLNCNSPECCIMKIPSGSRKLSVDAQRSGGNESGCGYASVVYPPTYSVGDQGASVQGKPGVQLLWAIPSGSCANIIENASYACSSNASCVDVPDVPGYICECNRKGFVGDGYLQGSGCFDIDECTDLSSNNCSADADCINTIGSYSCRCLEGFHGDGYANGTGCLSTRARFTQAVLLGCLGGAAIAISIVSYMFWKYKFKHSVFK